jgi:hypothetical protein
MLNLFFHVVLQLTKQNKSILENYNIDAVLPTNCKKGTNEESG